MIGEGALVVGEIHVATCIVTGGEVEANIRARDAIELYAPSRVTGALHAPAIFIDRGVQFEGTCKMAPLDGRDEAAAPARGRRARDDATGRGAHGVAHRGRRWRTTATRWPVGMARRRTTGRSDDLEVLQSSCCYNQDASPRARRSR